MDDCPAVPRGLVEFLKRAFPNQLPSNLLTLTDRELGALHGEQTVVSYLETVLRSQEESDVPT